MMVKGGGGEETNKGLRFGRDSKEDRGLDR